jgi:hypothetical protein
MVDAAEGVIGIEWIEGESVRHLLPGGAEEESDETEDDLDYEEIDLLSDYGVSKGWPNEPSSPSEQLTTKLFRDFDEFDWNGDCQNAHGRHHPW